MNLFQLGNFILNSGVQSKFKLECDALTDGDWETIAWMAAQRIGYFTAVEGVPRGGLKLAEQMKKYLCQPVSGERLLIVDDVGTTGNSMARQCGDRQAVGLVVFARNPMPPWIKVLFRGPMLED